MREVYEKKQFNVHKKNNEHFKRHGFGFLACDYERGK